MRGSSEACGFSLMVPVDGMNYADSMFQWMLTQGSLRPQARSNDYRIHTPPASFFSVLCAELAVEI